jgi:hypothetical protein
VDGLGLIAGGVMKTLVALIGVAALAAGLGACSSGGSSSGSTPSAPAKTTGTEVVSGKVTGPAALASSPVFHLKLTGPVTTTSTTSLGGSPKKGATHTFSTGAGNLTVTLNSSGTNTGGLKDHKTCLFAFATHVPLTVDSAKSTGKFSGATGSGQATVLFSGHLPKKSNGSCDTSKNAAPSPKTVTGTFTATVKMTVKH